MIELSLSPSEIKILKRALEHSVQSSGFVQDIPDGVRIQLLLEKLLKKMA